MAGKNIDVTSAPFVRRSTARRRTEGDAIARALGGKVMDLVSLLPGRYQKLLRAYYGWGAPMAPFAEAAAIDAGLPRHLSRVHVDTAIRSMLIAAGNGNRVDRTFRDLGYGQCPVMLSSGPRKGTRCWRPAHRVWGCNDGSLEVRVCGVHEWAPTCAIFERVT